MSELGVSRARRRAGIPEASLPTRLVFQRMRILSATIQICYEESFASASVSRIVKLAGVSRPIFYGLFADRDDCFGCALEDAAAQARVSIEPAFAAAPTATAAVRAALWSLLVFLDQEPQLAWLLVVESLAGDIEARRRRQEMLRALAIAAQARRVEEGTTSAPVAAEAMVGAVESVLYGHLVESRESPLTDLFEPLWQSSVAPHLEHGEGASVTAGAPSGDRGRVRPTRHLRTGREHGIRLTYRTALVLAAIGQHPGASNRRVAEAAGVLDEGQMSKLLSRLARLGLIEDAAPAPRKHGRREWVLTETGHELDESIRARFRPVAPADLPARGQARPGAGVVAGVRPRHDSRRGRAARQAAL